MMVGLVPDKNIEKVFQTLELFITNLSSLLAVFNNYQGSDFCCGLYFGSNGAGMLTDIASLFTLSPGAFNFQNKPPPFGMPPTPPPQRPDF